MAVLLLIGRGSAEETAKSESGSGTTEFKAGPLTLSVTVNGEQNGKALKTAFLGVYTAPLTPQLRSQLDLPDGMGLSVEVVAKDSPADKAGLMKYDVLKKFNDQMLCAQEQLAVLVKAAGKGTKVTLVVLRGGKEQNIEVLLEEHDAPETGKAQFSINGAPGVSIQVQDLDQMLQPGIAGNLLTEILNFNSTGNAGKGGSAGIQQNFEESRRKYEMRRKELDSQAEANTRKSGDGQIDGKNRTSSQAQVFSIYPDIKPQSIVTVSDGEGTVEITESNENRTLKIKGPSGQEVYSAPLNTGSDHDAVPEKFRDKVRDAESKIKKADMRVLKIQTEQK